MSKTQSIAQECRFIVCRYKQLFALGTESVTGLEYQLFPGTEEKYFVMASDFTTVSPSNRIHQFVWGPQFESTFSHLTKTKVLPGLFPKSTLSIYAKKGGLMSVCVLTVSLSVSLLWYVYFDFLFCW